MEYKEGIKHYFENNPGGYSLYYAVNVPTSKLSSTFSLLCFPQSFEFASNIVSVLGEKESKKLINLMIEAASKYHMGYQKPMFEEYIKFKDFTDKQRLLFDWVKTYAFIRRYTEFLNDRDKYIHPILFFDRGINKSFPNIHPGTARLRCTEFLYKSQRRDILLDIVYFNKDKEKLIELEKKLNIEWKKINTFEEYLRAYGYASMEMYNKKPKMVGYDPKYKVAWPEYIHFLKSDQYIPYLYETLYHLFKED